MTNSDKFNMIMNMVKRIEFHKCDRCDHTHEYETGLFTIEEIEKYFGYEIKTHVEGGLDVDPSRTLP